MKTVKYPTSAGDSFNTVAERASMIAASRNAVVEFLFNEVKCLVDAKTNLDYLYRDYANSWLMGWKSVGPECPEVHSPEIEAEMAMRKKARDEKQAAQEAEWRQKDEAERKAFELKTAGVEIELSDRAGWDSWKAKNCDPYGNCCFVYAESWAKLMQKEIASGKRLRDIAESTSFELGFLGITGFMYGAAVSILSKCWIHGEELRKWHNKEYNHEGEGVVNPAILRVG